MAPPPPPPTTQPLQPQQNSQAPRSLSPVSPPSSTNPFSDFDFLDNLSSGTAAPRPTKDSFFPPVQPPKTIQQLQMEKQVFFSFLFICSIKYYRFFYSSHNQSYQPKQHIPQFRIINQSINVVFFFAVFIFFIC